MAAPPDLEGEVARFRGWADAPENAGRDGDWEGAYPAWQTLWRAAESSLEKLELTGEEAGMLLYVIARDREEQWILERVKGSNGPHGMTLARAAIGFPDRDARWQMVDYLAGRTGDDAEDLLRTFTADADEYVGRRALYAVAKFDPAFAESLARRWLTAVDSQTRLTAFRVLAGLQSPFLDEAIEMLRDDPDALVRRTVGGFNNPA